MKNYFLFIYKEKNWKNLEIPKILGKYIMVKLGNTEKYWEYSFKKFSTISW